MAPKLTPLLAQDFQSLLNFLPPLPSVLPDRRTGDRVHIRHAVLAVCGMSDARPEEDRGPEGQLLSLPGGEVKRGDSRSISKMVQVIDGMLEQGHTSLAH